MQLFRLIGQVVCFCFKKTFPYIECIHMVQFLRTQVTSEETSLVCVGVVVLAFLLILMSAIAVFN